MLAESAALADTAFSRLKGLLGRRGIAAHEAMIITHCRSIHMFFMKFAIDAVFVNKRGVVVGLVENIKPFRMSPYFFSSSYVIELPVGKIRETRTRAGDEIKVTDA